MITKKVVKAKKPVKVKKIPAWLPKVGDVIEIVQPGLGGKTDSKRFTVRDVSGDGDNVRIAVVGIGALFYCAKGLLRFGKFVFDELFDLDRTEERTAPTVILSPVERVIRHWSMSKVVWPRPKKKKNSKA